MAGFVEGIERGQSTMFPARLDDYVAEDNPVRAVDAFVDGLDLAKLGFTSVQPSVARLNAINKDLQRSEDGQISLIDPDSRSMATSGKDTGIVGYNVQSAVDTKHHLIVAHEVTNVGTDIHQLATMAEKARAELGSETLEVVADRGYYEGFVIKACEDAGISVTLPRRQTSGAKAEGRFGKQDFVYKPEEDAYLCPAGEMLPYRFTNVQDGKTVHRYWTHACRDCRIKSLCTPSTERRVIRWEHEAVLEKVQARLDHNPAAMTMRRPTVEHPFGTIKCWMGATHFLCMTLPKVATEMALNVLAYNMKRVMNILGVGKLREAMRAVMAKSCSTLARVRWLLDAFRRLQEASWSRIAGFARKNRSDRAVVAT